MGNCLQRGSRNLTDSSHHGNEVHVTANSQVEETYPVHGDHSSEEEIKERWIREQNVLKEKVIIEDVDDWAKYRIMPDSADDMSQGRPLEYVGGVDLSFVKGDDVNACAGLVVLSFPDLKVVYEDMAMVKLTEPYISGFLAFREVNFLVDRLEKLEQSASQYMPQVILVDGNGILHPRGFGQACHLGVLLDIPCIGVAKNLLHVDGIEKNADHADKIKELKAGGDTFPLIGTSGTELGKALRTCDGSTNPVYVSVGHKISLDTAVWLVHKCSIHRIPEPVRQADLRSREYLRENFKKDEN